MKIINIEAFPVYPKFAKRNQDKLVRFKGINHRTIVKIEASNGITGYGDYRQAPPSEAEMERLVDRNPFDFIHNDLHMAIGGALFDLMGKHLEIPVYKLLGKKLRERVPVAAWSRPAPPDELAGEIQRASAEGYRIFKMHTCEHYDVFEQNRAVEEVAPDGFSMQWDFNSNRDLATVLPIVKKLDKSRVVGFIEDPLVRSDVEGWRQLRAQTEVPVVMHIPVLGGLQEMVQGMADAFIVGEYCGGLGDAYTRGLAYGKANVQTLIQLTGGTLTKAMAMHLAAVLPTAGHSINLDDQYEEDVVAKRLEIVEGCSPVPEEPGLGVEVDENLLQALIGREIPEIPRHVGVLTLPQGHVMYTPSLPSVSQLTGFSEGTVRGLHFEIWEDDGSDAFARINQRLESEGPFIETHHSP